MSYDFPLYLTELTDENIRNMINVNCFSITFMSKIVLPGMVEKRKGAIINISSLSGLREVPFLTVYSATKSFVEYFSTGLREEFQSKGITVQNVAPGFVATKLAKIRNPSLLVPIPASFVSSALCTLGVVPKTCGCITHALQDLVIRHVPDWLYMRLSNSLMLGARARGLKKRDKKE